MAEGLTNHFLGDEWQAYSAGTEPAGYVHPLAIKALAELGIDISSHTSKTADEFRQTVFDLVVTVCDDPAKTTGTDDEKLQVFRQVRDDIRDQVLAFLRLVIP